MPATTAADQLRELGAQLASGGAASAIAKTCIAPFERTKILLQTSNLVDGMRGLWVCLCDCCWHLTSSPRQ